MLVKLTPDGSKVSELETTIELEDGLKETIDYVVGTQANINGWIEFKNLILLIIYCV